MNETTSDPEILPKEELLKLLNELLEAERAGVKVAAAYRDDASSAPTRALLHTVHTDEARSCALLSKAIHRLGGEPSRAVGDFAERALALDDEPARLAFLNRGQRWVIRKLEAAIPRVDDAEVATWLGEMLALHVRNVLSCEELAE